MLDYQRLQQLDAEQQQAQQLLKESKGDAELEALAQEELQQLSSEQEQLNQRLRALLLIPAMSAA